MTSIHNVYAVRLIYRTHLPMLQGLHLQTLEKIFGPVEESDVV